MPASHLKDDAPATAGENLQLLRSMKIDDRQYELYLRACAECGEDHFEVIRWSGLSFSRYLPIPEFTLEDFEYFVETVDAALLQSAPGMIAEFHAFLKKANSPHGMVADDSFAFRLMEYGRLRLVSLKRQNFLEAITVDREPSDDVGRAVRAAFELGMAASEHRFMEMFEDYISAGINMEDWRAAGLPRAREERLRHGAKTRKAILDAAKKLHEGDRALSRNDLATAKAILRLKLPALKKGMGDQQLTEDAITKHLRAARRDGEL